MSDRVEKIASEILEAASTCLSDAKQAFAATGTRARGIPVPAEEAIAIVRDWQDRGRELSEARELCEVLRAERNEARADTEMYRQLLREKTAELIVENIEVGHVREMLSSTTAASRNHRAANRNLCEERDALASLLADAGEILELGERLVDYFSNNCTSFFGGGTPATFRRDAAAIRERIKRENRPASR